MKHELKYHKIAVFFGLGLPTLGPCSLLGMTFWTVESLPQAEGSDWQSQKGKFSQQCGERKKGGLKERTSPCRGIALSQGWLEFCLRTHFEISSWGDVF